MRSSFARAVLLAVGVCVHAACANHRPASLADRFMLRRDGNAAVQPSQPPSPTLEEAIGKTRQLMAQAHPEPKAKVETLESRDPALAKALSELQASPTAMRYVDVAEAYRLRGSLDQAYEHYMHALHADSHLAVAYDGLARVWRDWGFPGLGLGDAHRAIFYDPRSATAENTLGTIFQSLGRRKEARQAYGAAVSLDKTAGYPLSNLCYLSFVEGKASQAIAECRGAIGRDPQLMAAHNNLALTYAAIGRLDLAKQEFALAGPAAEAYNMGIVHLARREYARAAEQFDRASAEKVAAFDADSRARDARRLANVAPITGGVEKQ
jgi:Flp pilus assembly protein TadD